MSCVAYVQNEYPSLSQTFVSNEVRGLVDRGHEVLVIASRRGAGLPMSGDRVIVLSEQSWWSVLIAHLRVMWSAPRTYGRYVRAAAKQGLSAAPWSLMVPLLCSLPELRNARYVHTHFATRAAAVAFIVADWLQVPRGVTTHAADIYKPTRDLPRQLRGARVATSTQRNREVLANLGYSTDAVIPNGVPLREVLDRRAEPATRGGRLRIISVGRLVEKKGHKDLLAATAVLKADGVEVSCTIAGDGPDRDSLEQLVVELGIEDDVILLGSVPHDRTFDLYAAADVFALCSVEARDGDVDGLPVAVLDAASTGLPIIAPRISGLSEFVDDEVGWVVKSGDSLSIAGALRRAATSPSEIGSKGRMALERVRTRFSLDAQVDALWSLAGCDQRDANV